MATVGKFLEDVGQGPGEIIEDLADALVASADPYQAWTAGIESGKIGKVLILADHDPFAGASKVPDLAISGMGKIEGIEDSGTPYREPGKARSSRPGVGCRAEISSDADHGVAGLGGGVGDGREDIFSDHVWMGFQDLIIAVAGREVGENVGYANAKATQAGAPGSTDFGSVDFRSRRLFLCLHRKDPCGCKERIAEAFLADLMVRLAASPVTPAARRT